MYHQPLPSCAPNFNIGVHLHLIHAPMLPASAIMLIHTPAILPSLLPFTLIGAMETEVPHFINI